MIDSSWVGQRSLVSGRWNVKTDLNFSEQVFESALQLSELLVEKGKAMIDKGLKKSGDDKLEQELVLGASHFAYVYLIYVW